MIVVIFNVACSGEQYLPIETILQSFRFVGAFIGRPQVKAENL